MVAGDGEQARGRAVARESQLVDGGHWHAVKLDDAPQQRPWRVEHDGLICLEYAKTEEEKVSLRRT